MTAQLACGVFVDVARAGRGDLFRGFRAGRILLIMGALSLLGPLSAARANFTGGDGSVTDPYRIGTAEELDRVRDHLDAHFLQIADIDLGVAPWNEGDGWVPIGALGSANRFTGSFDGGGHAIRNLTINRPDSNYQGLFGYVYRDGRDALLQNIRLEDIDLRAGRHSGGLAGYAHTVHFRNIRVAGNIESGQSWIGGMAGQLIDGAVQNVVISADVSGSENVGGLAGELYAAELRHVSSSGSVSGTTKVGGLAGTMSMWASITDSYTHAMVSGQDRIGGLVGEAMIANLFRCYSAGPVSGTGTHVGGLLGGISDLGGDTYPDGTDFQCYWDIEASGLATSALGEGRTTVQMQRRDTFDGYNFQVLWQIEEGAGYPVLQDLSRYALPQPVGLAALEGDGTPSSPYIITAPDELNAVRQDTGAHYRLGNDIDLAATAVWDYGRGWKAIGPQLEDAFIGTFDGGGHVIRNLHINRPVFRLLDVAISGLFAMILEGDVYDVRLEDIDISHGALLPAGGLVGLTFESSIENVFVSGRIMAPLGEKIGGVTGSFGDNGAMKHVAADVTVRGVEFIGGLAGQAGADAELRYVYAMGSVAGAQRVGGLLGHMHGQTTVDQAYSAAEVRDGMAHIGGLVGSGSGTATAAYWDVEASGQTQSARGEGRTTAGMTWPHDAENTYIGWDFTDVWMADAGATRNNGYPVLRALARPQAVEILSPIRSGTLVARDLLRFRGVDPGMPGLEYEWDFGDGRIGAVRDPGLVSFPEPGEYTVTFSVRNGSGELGTDQRVYTVVPDTGGIADLRVTSLDALASAGIGETIEVAYTVRNVGQAPAGPSWIDAVYLSRDGYLDTRDTLLATETVTRELAVDGSYRNTIAVTLPAVLQGAYHLILSVNDDWRILERHRLNNEEAVPVSIDIPLLEPGATHQADYPAGRLAHYYRVSGAGDMNLLLTLANADPRIEVYLRYEAIPGRRDYDYRLDGGHVLIPNAAVGDWYVLLYGAMDRPGAYEIGFDLSSLLLTRSLPPSHGTETDLQLTLEGSGFRRPLGVSLIGGGGAVYDATTVAVDSYTMATAWFTAGAVPPGHYTVRVAADGQAAELQGALEIVDGGSAQLDVNLILPPAVGHAVASTLYVEYANIGNVSMPAPLLQLTAMQDGVPAALLTLDESRVRLGLWGGAVLDTEDDTVVALPPGFSTAVEFLASGEIPGMLMPGESYRRPVYYAGCLQPWGVAFPPLEWELGMVDANDQTAMQWDALKDDSRPDYVREDAWDIVWANFLAQAGETAGDYIAMLSRNARILHRQGLRIQEVESLLAFSFRQAEGLSLLDALAVTVDAALEAPGLPLFFERRYAQPVSRRFELGPLGRGWTHNWQIRLKVEPDRSITVTDSSGMPRIFTPDRRYAGRYLSVPGDHGSLRAVSGGYRLTEKDGLVWMFSTSGRLSWVEDTNGNRISLEYMDGQLTRLGHSAGPELTLTYQGSRLHTLTDRQGRQTIFSYQGGEYLATVRADDGRFTTYDYHTAAGVRQHALREIGLPDGTTRSFTYDFRGRLGSLYRDDHAEKISFGYTADGRVTMTDPLDHASRLFFDHWGRIVTVESPLGETLRMDFDDRGNLIAVTDPDGFSATFEYDGRGNLAKVTDPLRRTTRFTHTRTLNRLASFTDAAQQQTLYMPDDSGNIERIIYPDGSSEQWLYNDQGNPRQWTNRRGTAIRYSYDDDGRLERKEYLDGSQVDAVYRYNAHGNLEEAANAAGTTTFTFDDGDRRDYLIRVDYPDDRWLEFDYDEAGRRRWSRDQLGHRIDYEYDQAGRLYKLSDGGGDPIVTYAYDELGRIRRKTLGNGVSATYSYDPAGRLERLVNRTGDDVEISRFEYVYDRRGRRIAMQTHYGAWTYEYDAAGQLTKAALVSTDPDIPNQELLYAYDALGNRTRTTVNGQNQDWEPDLLNQYTRVGDTTYVYCPDGNLIETDGPDGITAYTYDTENRLIGLARGGEQWEYGYDALGNRVAVDANGAATHYVIDPIGFGNVVAEYDGNGTPIARHTHGYGLAARHTPGGASHFYVFDGIGSVSEVTGAAGAVANRYRYRPFGVLLDSQAAVASPFRFGGRLGVMADPTGLLHMRARHYDPATGHFLGRDPIGLAGGDMNLYRYAFGNPVSLVDPLGLRACAVAGAALDLHGAGGKVMLGAKLVAAGTALAPAGLGIPLAALGGGLMVWGAIDAGRAGYALGEAAFGDRRTSFNEQFSKPFGPGASNSLLRPGENNRISPRRNARSAGRGFGRSMVTRATVGAFCAWNQDGITPFELLMLLLTGGMTDVIGGMDPNQKLAAGGFGDANFIAAGSLLSYRVDFENLESAPGPAQVVSIRDPLCEQLDFGTLELAEFGFGDILVAIPPGRQVYETVVDYVYEDEDYQFDIEVHVEIWLEEGILYALFMSIDPVTGMPPQDPTAGFLPPEDETGRGQGFVSYLIRPKPDLTSGAEIRNVATIQFDFGLEIATNQVDPLDPSQGTDPNLEALVTIDAIPPTSSVEPLPVAVWDPTFAVAWSGEDDEFGSGIGAYDVYARRNGEPWQLWLAGTSATAAMYPGEDGQTYSFYSVAADNVGNREVKPAAAEASTTVNVGNPMLLHVDLDAENTVTLQFGEAQDATAGFHALWDEVAPQDAAAYLFNRLEPDAARRKLVRDVRPVPADGLTRWRLEVLDSPARGTVTLRWDVGAAVASREIWLQPLRDERPVGLPVDMRTTTILHDVQRGREFEIVHGELEAHQVTLRRGWNAVAPPVLTLQPLGELLTAAEAAGSVSLPAWTWRGEHFDRVDQNDAFNPEVGHMIYSTAAGITLELDGLPPDGVILLQPGWNLVSPVRDMTIPEGNALRLPAWRWDTGAGRYRPVPAGGKLEAGYVYWLYVDGNLPVRLGQ